MDDQLDIFSLQSADSKTQHIISYEDAKTCLLDILSAMPNSKDHVSFKMNQNDMAVSFFATEDSSGRSMWIKLGKKKNKLEVKHSYYYVVDSLSDQKFVAESGFGKRVPLPFSSPMDLSSYASTILAIYDYREREAEGKLFGCCHRFLECSDARTCTHPDQNVALSCYYRQNLKSGKIFYGMNRNID